MSLRKCLNCGMENPHSAQFCAACGADLESGAKAPVSQTEPGEAQPAAALPEELIPESIFGERYKIIEELGTGSLGMVYKIFDKAFDRDLALKAIKPEIAQKKEAFEHFSRALRMERTIVHRNVGRIFELHAEKDPPFITMEYVPGQNLAGFLKEKRRLTIENILDLAKQLSDGLAEVQRLGLVHLDLKPSKIMIDKSGTVKIMDLGIARFLQSKGITDPDIRPVTPEYMSPEQIEGKEADARSDIYSLGIIFYELATGSVPFTAETSDGVRTRHLTEIPKNPRELNPRIPEKFNLLILRCLEKEREKRYQTAREVRSDLEEIEISMASAPAAQPVSSPSEKLPVSGKVEPAKAARTTREPGPALKKVKVSKFVIPRKAMLPALIASAIIILGIITWQVILKPSKGKTAPLPGLARESVAILPFEDLSPTKDRDYLGEGMADMLIDALTSIPGTRIPARTSSFSFKGKGRSSPEIGQKLGVGHVLEASFQIAEKKLQMAVKLVKAKDAAIVWSNQYDRNLEDIFDVQEEIGQEIARAIKAKLPAEKENSLLKKYTANPEAFDLYAQGRFLWAKGNRESLEKSAEYFEKAAGKDPAYALAYAGLARTHVDLGLNSFRLPIEAFPKAKSAVLKALDLDPNLADAHTSYAIIKGTYDWDFAAAEKEFKEALRTEPNNAEAHHFYAVLLSALGRHEEAIAEIKLARDLDPLSRRINAQVGAALYYSRLYDQAVQESIEALSADSLSSGNYYFLGMAYIQMERREEAISSFRQAAASGGDVQDVNLRIAYVLALQGRRQEVGKILAEALRVSKETYIPSTLLATVYAGVGEKDQVLACLEKASAERDAGLIFLKVHPMFDFLRRDRQFIGLLQKIGLEK